MENDKNRSFDPEEKENAFNAEEAVKDEAFDAEDEAFDAEDEAFDTEDAEGKASDTENAEETEASEKPKKDWKKELREWVVSICIALLVVFVIRSFLFQIIRVDGESMYPTLYDNERLFVTVLDVKLHGIERGDIVICHYPNRGNTNFVKRAVAVPGDSVYRKDGVTHVVYETVDENGETVSVDDMLDERYALYFQGGSSDDYEPYVLGENEYFVVGDNRYNSHDARDWKDSNPINDVGPITGDMLVGRVSRVIWPIKDVRSLDQ